MAESRREITHETWNTEYENIAKEGNYVVYFTGTIDENGINWCSDCVETNDSVVTIENNCKSANIPFLAVRAGLREAWRNPENALRTHK
mmetsp:Transcript_16455/g.2282  ORF Transcript_16455/g.2282 Transcript_16455/m.2282 type:complete len:89 (-) Transcript_16455:202-468(-)